MTGKSTNTSLTGSEATEAVSDTGVSICARFANRGCRFGRGGGGKDGTMVERRLLMGGYLLLAGDAGVEGAEEEDEVDDIGDEICSLFLEEPAAATEDIAVD